MQYKTYLEITIKMKKSNLKTIQYLKNNIERILFLFVGTRNLRISRRNLYMITYCE